MYAASQGCRAADLLLQSNGWREWTRSERVSRKGWRTVSIEALFAGRSDEKREDLTALVRWRVHAARRAVVQWDEGELINPKHQSRWRTPPTTKMDERCRVQPRVVIGRVVGGTKRSNTGRGYPQPMHDHEAGITFSSSNLVFDGTIIVDCRQVDFAGSKSSDWSCCTIRRRDGGKWQPPSRFTFCASS